MAQWLSSAIAQLWSCLSLDLDHLWPPSCHPWTRCPPLGLDPVRQDQKLCPSSILSLLLSLLPPLRLSPSQAPTCYLLLRHLWHPALLLLGTLKAPPPTRSSLRAICVVSQGRDVPTTTMPALPAVRELLAMQLLVDQAMFLLPPSQAAMAAPTQSAARETKSGIQCSSSTPPRLPSLRDPKQKPGSHSTALRSGFLFQRFHPRLLHLCFPAS